jgi:eukaryotic-like serine/threonine-protein kinase
VTPEAAKSRSEITPEHWERLKELLVTALDMGAAERTAYLDQIRDPSLRSDLERLLAAEKNAGTGFLNDSAIAAELSVSPGEGWIGRRVGPYRIAKEIGEGGMGTVYQAVRADDQYQKVVAIKVVRSGFPMGPDFVRFKVERQILANLEHPNVTRLLDGGTTNADQPYLVMELVEGQPIDQYCDAHKLSIGERLGLFLCACSAVQYAHQNLIVHRDLKPGNILVTPEGVPKLLDFGIAKILDPLSFPGAAEFTTGFMRILTPEYASPEQVRGETITTASDVYSLGVVLYVLLTGHHPYALESRSPQDIAKAVCDAEPLKPSVIVRRRGDVSRSDDTQLALTPEIVSSARSVKAEKLRRQLAGDLDNIVLMALRKEPQRRYASVEQFSQDIRRHLENLPVVARADTLRYRTSKFLARHKGGMAAAAAVLVTLLVGMAVTVREARIARQQAEVARMQRVRAERRFNDVRNLANSLLFDIHDSIVNLPGATAARKVLVDRAVQYLDSLAQEAAEDPGLQREVASAYERLGDLQDKPLSASSSLGDEVAAMQSYNKSLNLREKLARTNQANAADAVSLARIHRLIANAEADSGDVSTALEHAKRALAISTAASEARRGNNTATEAELAWDYMALGNIESRGGFNSIGLSEPYTAIRNSEKALAIASELLKNDPDNASLAYEVAGLYERIGGLQGMNGNRPEGLRKLNLSLSMFRSAGTRSGDASLPSIVASVSSIIGIVLEMDGRFQSALTYYDLELATFKSRAEQDPQDMMARSDLSGAYYDVGDTLVKMGMVKDGLATIRRAIALDKELVSVDPKRGALRSLLAQHRVAEAEALNKVGDAAGALQSYKEARSLHQSLAELDDLNLDARLNVSATDAKIAATDLRLREVDDAREMYLRALRVSEPPAGGNPPNLQAQYTLADSYSGLGDVAVYLARKTNEPIRQFSYWTEASSWYEKSLRVWRAIPNRSVISPSEFDVGDPGQVANRFAVCKAALAKQKMAPDERADKVPSPKAQQ